MRKFDAEAVWARVLGRAPGKYVVHSDAGNFEVVDVEYVSGLHDYREAVVNTARARGMKPLELATVLMELSVSLFSGEISRDKLVENVELWFDSEALSHTGDVVPNCMQSDGAGGVS